MARPKKTDMSANFGFEVKLWLIAGKLCNNMDAAERKHVIPGLVYAKCITDSFHRALHPGLGVNGTCRTVARRATPLTATHS